MQTVSAQHSTIAEAQNVFFDETQHDTLRAEAAIQLANNIYNSDLDSSLRLIEKAHFWSKKHNYKKGLSVTFGFLGFIYHSQGDYLRGIDAYQTSIEFNRKNHFNLNLAMDLGNYGTLLSELKDAKGIAFCKEGIEIYKQEQRPDDIAYLYSYIGSDFNKNDLIDSSIYYYQLGMSFAKAPDTKATLTRQLSESYLAAGNYPEAMRMINDAEELISRETNLSGLKLILITKANVCFKSNLFDEAQSCINELEALKDVETNTVGALLYDELRARLEYHFGHYQSAYDLINSAYNRRSELYDEELIDLIKRKYIEFEYQEKNVRDSIKAQEESEFRELKYEATLQEEANRRNILWGSVISLLVIVGLIAFGYFKNRRNTKIIEDQNTSLELKNTEIIDSISYAKRIQSVILPSTKTMEKAFPKSFVFNKPKTIIGGDFYWLFEKDNLRLLAVADCTGHGVPGALLSVICSEALNRAVGEFKLEDPADILNKVRELIKDHLMDSNEKLTDGMDISLIGLRKNTEEESIDLSFAGANSSILVRTVKGVETLRGDRQPIGKYFNESAFQNTHLELKKGDMIFLSTDGYVDQFGGKFGKKMKLNPFIEFLQSIASDSISEYESRIVAHFETWKGNEEQVDDVCFLGIQIT